MANYKDIITGTINSVVGKVKDVTDGSSVRGIYEQGAERAKAYAQIAKLTLEANGCNEELKKIFCEIGRLYYEQAKDAPEGYFAPLFAQAENVFNDLDAKKAELEELKALIKVDSGDIEVEIVDDTDDVISEFDEIVSADEEENK